jgi:hypothetical protein
MRGVIFIAEVAVEQDFGLVLLSRGVLCFILYKIGHQKIGIEDGGSRIIFEAFVYGMPHPKEAPAVFFRQPADSAAVE